MSRREWLKLVGLSGLGFFIESNLVIPPAYRWLAERLRAESPPELVHIPDNSVLSGISPNKNNLGEAKRLSNVLEKDFHIVNFFVNSVGGFDAIKSQLQSIAADKKVPMISWYPTDDSRPDIFRYKDTYAYEPEIKRGAVQLKQLGVPVLFRPLYEMNGTWWAWHTNNSPNDAIAYWQFVHDVYRSVKAENVKFVFSPNVTINALPIEQFYPWSDYVDFVSLDAYDRFSNLWTNPRHIVEPDLLPQFVLGPDLCTLVRIAPGKPYIQGEIGSQREYGKAEWLEKAVRYVITHMPNTRAIIPFQWGNPGDGTEDWQIIRDEPVLYMYRMLLDELWFLQPKSGTLPGEALLRPVAKPRP